MGHEAHNKCLHGYMSIRFKLTFIEAILPVSRIASPQKETSMKTLSCPQKE